MPNILSPGDGDIINLGVREFYAKLSVGGEIREAFSAKTLSVKYSQNDYSDDIHDYSRKHYGTPKALVVQLLNKWDESGEFENTIEVPQEFEQPIL